MGEASASSPVAARLPPSGPHPRLQDVENACQGGDESRMTGCILVDSLVYSAFPIRERVALGPFQTSKIMPRL